MRKIVFSALTAVLCASLTVAAFATITRGGDVPKGSLVVRYGNASASNNYKDQDGYGDGNSKNKLQGVSALCADGSQGLDAGQLIADDNAYTGPKNVYRVASSTTLINAGAQVKWDPIESKSGDNLNHCLISNIKIKDITSAFHT